MIIASKGAAGVTGAGLATLAGGLASHRPELRRRRRPDRRHRPVHVRGSGADQLRRQRGRDGAGRHLDRARSTATRSTAVLAGKRPVRRAHDARRGPLRRRPVLDDPGGRRPCGGGAPALAGGRVDQVQAEPCDGGALSASVRGAPAWRLSRCSIGSVESPVKIISCSAWARRTTSSGIAAPLGTQPGRVARRRWPRRRRRGRRRSVLRPARPRPGAGRGRTRSVRGRRTRSR